MARRPNYRFERQERERQKAAKKAERQKAKQERSDRRKGLGEENAEDTVEGDETPQ